MAFSVRTLAALMCEGVEPEGYHADHLRKSTGKTRPMGGGRTPYVVQKWDTFEQELSTWWDTASAPSNTSPSDLLAQVHASAVYPRKALLGRNVVITKEDEVRAALMICVFNPVNEALDRGLGLSLVLNATESIACVKSNVDWACFSIDTNRPDIYVKCKLPIEVKPPWQLRLEPGEHAVDLLSSDAPAERDKVRFGVAQVYLYMILEESEYGVLCSKEQYMFLKRIGNPQDKVLMISRVFSHDDPVGAQRCMLFMCCLAQNALPIPKSVVDQPGETPLSRKLVTPPNQKRKQKRSDLRQASSRKADKKRLAVLGQERSSTSTCDEPSILSFQKPVTSSCWIRKRDGAHSLVDWFMGLAEFDIFSLHLDRVLSSAGTVIVREAIVWDEAAAIKMFDFTEGQDKLEDFYKEVVAYHVLQKVQGVAVPRLLCYGSLWGGFMGFLALSLEGGALTKCNLQDRMALAMTAKHALDLIHGFKVLHGDVSLSNMVQSRETGNVMFIDFSQNIMGVDEEILEDEMNDCMELFEEEWDDCIGPN